VNEPPEPVPVDPALPGLPVGMTPAVQPTRPAVDTNNVARLNARRDVERKPNCDISAPYRPNGVTTGPNKRRPNYFITKPPQHKRPQPRKREQRGSGPARNPRRHAATPPRRHAATPPRRHAAPPPRRPPATPPPRQPPP